MVNAGLVNRIAAGQFSLNFCEIFRALGRFLRFKTSVKYKSSLRINQNFPRKSPAPSH